MKCFLKLFVLTMVILSSKFLYGQQDSIILLNGRVFRGDIEKVSDGMIFYKEKNRKGDVIDVTMPVYRVFSFTQDGSETILYKQDELNGDFLTITETQHATLGSYDARKTCKPRIVFWTSFLLGYGASLLDTYYSQNAYNKFVEVNGSPPTQTVVGFFGADPTFFPVLVPITLSAVWGLPSFKIKQKQIIQKDLFGNEMYYRGYHRIAKQKRIFSALKGSFIGIASGMLTYAMFKNN